MPLFGPRGTGKTTWLQAVLPGAHWVNLLPVRQFLQRLGEGKIIG